MNCIVTKHPDPNLRKAIPTILVDLGMFSLEGIGRDWKGSYTVMLDGKVIGLIAENIISKVVYKLRFLKIKGKIPPTTEIVLVPKKKFPAQYPGLFLFTGPARLMRPVRNLPLQEIELIGTFEQVFLNICVTPEEAHEEVRTLLFCIYNCILEFLKCTSCYQLYVCLFTVNNLSRIIEYCLS